MCFPFFVECASGFRCFSRFFVEDRADISVESTIVPFSAATLFPEAVQLLGQTASPAGRCKSEDCESAPAYLRSAPDCWTRLYKSLKTHGCPLLLPLYPRLIAYTNFQHIQSQHQFQIVGLIPAFSFIITQLYDFDPFAP